MPLRNTNRFHWVFGTKPVGEFIGGLSIRTPLRTNLSWSTARAEGEKQYLQLLYVRSTSGEGFLGEGFLSASKPRGHSRQENRFARMESSDHKWRVISLSSAMIRS